jgi:hypothetical protein
MFVHLHTLACLARRHEQKPRKNLDEAHLKVLDMLHSGMDPEDPDFMDNLLGMLDKRGGALGKLLKQFGLGGGGGDSGKGGAAGKFAMPQEVLGSTPEERDARRDELEQQGSKLFSSVMRRFLGSRETKGSKKRGGSSKQAADAKAKKEATRETGGGGDGNDDDGDDDDDSEHEGVKATGASKTKVAAGAKDSGRGTGRKGRGGRKRRR